MAQFIVKAAPDHDLYIEWSTISDTPTAIGNRAEMVDHLAQSEGPSDPPEARLARADETGTSIKGEPPLRGAWDDSGFIVQKTQTNDDGPFGWLAPCSAGRVRECVLRRPCPS